MSETRTPTTPPAPQLRLLITPLSSHLRWDLIAVRYSGRVCRSVPIHQGTGSVYWPITTERDCLVAAWRALGDLCFPPDGQVGFQGAELATLEGLLPPVE